jgi:hypothetical protein
MITNANTTRRDARNEAPYTRMALMHPANLAVLAAIAVLAAVTGHTWLLLSGAAAEAVWLLLAPSSATLRARLFDPLWSASLDVEDEARLGQKVAAMAAGDRARVGALVEQRRRIEELARDNPSFATSMVQKELVKLGRLVEDFADMGGIAARSERYLAATDAVAMQRGLVSYAAQIDGYPERDPRRAIAKKNLDVMRRRSERHADLVRSLGTTRGQMDLIENTFRLLADEIVTMVSPSELGQRLDDLRIAVDAIRETVEQADVEEIDFDFEEQRGAA